MKTLSSVVRLFGLLALTTSALAADSSPMIPLTEFPRGHSYHGESGGLYGSGSNQPPPALLQAALDRAALVRPLDAGGRAATNGRIGLVAIGMSNTSQEFSGFQRLVSTDPGHNSQIVLVNGAQGGMDSGDWAAPDSRLRRDELSPWDQLLTRVGNAGLTTAQVQVVWISHARRRPEALGDFPAHARKLEEDLRAITTEAARRFPNLQLIYLSSRNYAGYAKNRLNPEPYAYESASRCVGWCWMRRTDARAGP